MDTNTCCLVIDIWEGQENVDFTVLKANGVAGVGIRFNDMNGGHHVDKLFTQHWEAAKNMVRFPYFVFNPWVDGLTNYHWLIEHLPVGCKFVAVDVEVRYPGYSNKKYAGELELFTQACKAKGIKTMVYTGAGYLDLLSKWPMTDYWWAQYPSQNTFFGGVKTWDDLRKRIANLARPFNSNLIPGTLKMWQFSGDYLILPGSNRDMDVNVFYGTESDLETYFGYEVSTEPVLETPISSVIVENSVGLYTFSPVNYTYRLGGGPLTLPLTRSRGKIGDNMTNYAWDLIKAIITRLNPMNQSAAGLVANPDWGPTKGIEADKVKWIGLLWPGRNIVKINEIINGWGRVNGVSLVNTSNINAFDTPELVHMVYDFNKVNGYGLRTKPVYVPIIGGPWWVQMDKLISVDSQLPKKVKVMVATLNLRTSPNTTFGSIGHRWYCQTVEILNVVLGERGIWGWTKDGWLALRFNDKNYTDWRI